MVLSGALAMNTSTRNRSVVEFGDFQTPPRLAESVCNLLSSLGIEPVAVIEPTCGEGNFLRAALDRFGKIRIAVALDINPHYVAAVNCALQAKKAQITVLQGDFFKTDWPAILQTLPDPVLVIGNPPWITNSALSALQSANVPRKSNLHAYDGLDALTGKSNFDISE